MNFASAIAKRFKRTSEFIVTQPTQIVISRTPIYRGRIAVSVYRWRLLLALGCCVFLASGCKTVEPNMISASELPLHYRAAYRTEKPPIDLSALARRSLNSDLIYPGDVLDVTLLTGAEKEQPEPLPYRVTPQGTLELPLVGEVRVAGLTLTGAEEQIHTQSVQRRVYRSPTVTVLMNTRQSDRVLVVGAVKEPKVYELPRAGSDLLAAITAAGGLTEEAGTVIEIRHPMQAPDGVQQAGYASDLLDSDGQVPTSATMEATSGQGNSVHVDLVEAMSGKAADLSLNDGSVVWVKQHRPETVYVHGLVKQAGEFELPKGKPLRVDQAIALAQGRSIEFADRVHVTRFVSGREEPIVIDLSMKEAKTNRDSNIVLIAGDVVSVEETPTTFTVDFLRNFFRIGFSSAIPGF